MNSHQAKLASAVKPQRLWKYKGQPASCLQAPLPRRGEFFGVDRRYYDDNGKKLDYESAQLSDAADFRLVRIAVQVLGGRPERESNAAASN